ncbi:hypothetical protein RT717_12120 [Imperialibacter roseus]|uniref:Sensor domain-containing protein n=1 Tax=Imperialibacter roseus TaxID=1324217 RepID=A0ABZ0IZM1_9BACT|nr:hypothetical protein [Imperialibacter roseus]WOK09385.1 hypothetical protein RT717_12120 [Imperialibacter roseus]
MERSIEAIWKEGFLVSDALVAPKINQLYSQKSKHIVDKFKRMFEINLIAILIFSVVLLPVSFLFGMAYMGVPMFLLLNAVAVVNKRLSNGLKKIDKSVSSYQYLKAFDGWMKEQISINTKMSAFNYPWVFLSMLAGFWFFEIDGRMLGDALMNKILTHYPDTYLVGGISLIGIIGVMLAVFLLAFFGGRLYKFELKLIYGNVMNRLQEMLADMEELRR